MAERRVEVEGDGPDVRTLKGDLVPEPLEWKVEEGLLAELDKREQPQSLGGEPDPRDQEDDGQEHRVPPPPRHAAGPCTKRTTRAI